MVVVFYYPHRQLLVQPFQRRGSHGEERRLNWRLLADYSSVMLTARAPEQHTGDYLTCNTCSVVTSVTAVSQKKRGFEPPCAMPLLTGNDVCFEIFFNVRAKHGKSKRSVEYAERKTVQEKNGENKII